MKRDFNKRIDSIFSSTNSKTNRMWEAAKSKAFRAFFDVAFGPNLTSWRKARDETDHIWVEALREECRIRDDAVKEIKQIWEKTVSEVLRVRSEAMKRILKIWEETVNEANQIEKHDFPQRS